MSQQKQRQEALKTTLVNKRHSPDGWAFWAVFCPVEAFRNKNGVGTDYAGSKIAGPIASTR